ncbi:hypothetical protein GGU10DRAFT_390780 [Lentinula aff. detonsa]|uniref:F-box domain-containing protein n=1 Tax=Lentinula aff. detonsa TaxID=2804958 RepID=A0AA38KWZ4_9AGAR|nr:hypothetical protein GGU10DRAFT_390780 [Lentinula aff. detonsa]
MNTTMYQMKYEACLAKTRMNDVPLSSQELSELQEDISATRHELQCCDDDGIETLLVKTLDFQESLLSPIRKLPSEMLEAIFYLVVALPESGAPRSDADVLFEISLSLDDKKFVGRVFALIWVCSWWRRLALAQTVLWSSIAVVDDSQRIHDAREQVELLKCILRRSGTSGPMDFRLHISSRLTVTRHDTLPFLTIFSSVPFDHTQNSFVETFTRYASRWRSFTFLTNSRTNSETFYEVLATQLATLNPSTQFPFLEKLELGSGFSLNDESLLAIKTVRTAFSSSCPRLRSLGIYSLASSDPMDLKSLTVLELHNYSGRSFAYLLNHCPLLKSFTVRFFYRGQDPNLDSDTAYIDSSRHTCLRILRIKGMGEEFTSGAWDLIYLPNLEEVVVSFWLRMDGDVLNELGELLTRSNCTLRKVQLLWDSFHISEYSVLESFLHGIPFNPGCEYIINEGRYPRTH